MPSGHQPNTEYTTTGLFSATASWLVGFDYGTVTERFIVVYSKKIMMKTGEQWSSAKHSLHNNMVVFINSILAGLGGGTVTERFAAVY